MAPSLLRSNTAAKHIADKNRSIIRLYGETSMASSREYLNFILDQLSDVDGISYRAMMGEYILYYNGKVVGGIYDDRLLVKPVKAAAQMLTDAKTELPYKGGKGMLLVEDVDNRQLLSGLLKAAYDGLPPAKKK